MSFTDLKLQLFSHTLYFVFTVIEGKCGTLSTVKEGNEADRENKVNENKVMVETLPKPSAAIQNGSRPDFPSTEPLHKPSVASVAVVGFTKVSCFVLFKIFPPCFFTNHPS